MQQKHNKQHKPHSTFNSVKGLRHSLCQTGFVEKIQYTNKITEEMLIPGKKTSTSSLNQHISSTCWQLYPASY